MMDNRRKSAVTDAPGNRAIRSSVGRWSLLNEDPDPASASPQRVESIGVQAITIAAARRTDAALESAARMLLARYGILFRDLLVRESNAPKWRDLLGILRRLEARGEIRGGRFVSGFGGEQFALPQAVYSLRAASTREDPAIITVAAADPMNLVGIVVPGDRVAAIPGKQVRYSNGHAILDEDATVLPKRHAALVPPILPVPRPTNELRLFQ
jgi:ATP-dependent Lhr-like helicase